MEIGKLNFLVVSLSNNPHCSVQWGNETIPTVLSATINLPVSVTTIYSALAIDGGTGAYSLGVTINGATATVYQNARQNPDNSIVEIYFRYIMICK